VASQWRLEHIGTNKGGKMPEKQKNRRLPVRMTEAEYEELDKMAKEEGRSLSAMIIRLITEEVKRRESAKE